MTRQRTIAASVSVAGAGLHTDRRATVVLRPAPPGFGRRVAREGATPAPIIPERWLPRPMSTAVRCDDGRSVRTIEHLMAALTAYGVDNVEIAIDGPEVPIFDGSAARWCRALRDARVIAQDAPRRALRILSPIQILGGGGFLRAEPGEGFAVDVSHDLLPAFPVMRWHGPIEADRFEAELSRARSFGNLHRRLGLTPPPARRPEGAAANAPDPALAEPAGIWEEIAARAEPRTRSAPLLRGYRPWRATLVLGPTMLPPRRFRDEPVRHVALDMIGDLSLAGLPLVGRIVAHNPSHEKTFALVLALMASPHCWEVVEDPPSQGAEADSP